MLSVTEANRQRPLLVRTIDCCDAFQWLANLPSESVDLVVTDPPYESLEKHRNKGTTTRLQGEWFETISNSSYPELMRQFYSVLRPNSHCYVFTDAETMFYIKPAGEAAGFKFWKPLVWDKCLAPETPVCTQRGVVPIDNVTEDDFVAVPDGGYARVLARRKTHRPALRLSLSDGTSIRCSEDHPFVLDDMRQIMAGELFPGSRLLRRPVNASGVATIDVAKMIPEDRRIYELPDTNYCLWCNREFGSSQAAAAHQARWCATAMSKKAMADKLGITTRRLRRWMRQGRIPALWACQLGIQDKLSGRSQLYLQNDAARWFPETIELDYELGKVVGLYAAEGSAGEAGGVVFGLHTSEKHLQALIARVARRVGVRAIIRRYGNSTVVHVSFLVFGELMRTFIGGTKAPLKYMKPVVYGAPEVFRRGVFDGLQEGDGHWSHDEQRQTLNISSLDLAMFAHRFVNEHGGQSTVRRFENDCAGGWKVRFDPIKESASLEVISVENIGSIDLIDIAIDDPLHLYVLGNGVVTHNCKMGMGYHYRARYELILFFEKGYRKLRRLATPDVLAYPRLKPSQRRYPTEKPVALLKTLIDQSATPGEIVIDPFMGSGSALVAAKALGCEPWGCDLKQKSYNITMERLNG